MKLTGEKVWMLTFDMVDLNDCAGVYSSYQGAIDALMSHYARMKNGLDWRWTEPEIAVKSNLPEHWIVYEFDLLDLQRDQSYRVGAVIERVTIDAV